MHVTTKEVDDNGVHIITSQIESDGPNALCSDEATFEASVISTQRTESGGVKVQVALNISEPKPEAEPEAAKPAPSAEEQAASYLESKGLSNDEAKSAVEKFGAANVLSKRQAELEQELSALVSAKA